MTILPSENEEAQESSAWSTNKRRMKKDDPN
jgi:hypothetical protein